MRYLITAGGTREAIDAVRVVANRSTGRLGACLAEQAAEAGHEVVLLRAAEGARPAVDGITCHDFESSADLAALLTRHAPAADVIVQAAAVSDFVPRTASGKLSSDAEELVLVLDRAPKLIDGLRDLCPGGVLVGFKLTAGRDEAEQVVVARKLLARARLDLVVANDAGALGNDEHVALLVGERGDAQRCVGKGVIAREVVAVADRLAGSRSAEHTVDGRPVDGRMGRGPGSRSASEPER